MRRALAILMLLPALAYTGEPVPNFALKTLSGDLVTFDDYKGNVILINFWAVWCGPCRIEMPVLDEIYQRFQDAGLVILGINIERDPETARQWLDKNPVSFPVFSDPDHDITKLFEIATMPYSIIVDQQGNIVYAHSAYLPGDEAKYIKVIEKLIE